MLVGHLLGDLLRDCLLCLPFSLDLGILDDVCRRNVNLDFLTEKKGLM